MKYKRKYKNLFVITFLLITAAVPLRPVHAQATDSEGFHILKKGSSRKFFRYRPGSPVIISGHRGGREMGYPENSLEGFSNVLRKMPAFFEIDPRLTKDSVIVLMHDATLDRTTTAKGSLNDYTYEELRDVRLRDFSGNPTACSIPTLEEVIVWSRGRTVVNLDRKDVPPEMIVDLVKRLRASAHLMLTVHNGTQAKYYHENLPKAMLSAFARTMKEYEDIASSGVPWKKMIAYVGPAITTENAELVSLLHSRGVRCMISVAPTHDRLPSAEERREGYLKEMACNPDIIETDLPLEVWNVMKEKQAAVNE
jgi:glycerophosphoryl diester phosphodiesterase